MGDSTRKPRLDQCTWPGKQLDRVLEDETRRHAVCTRDPAARIHPVNCSVNVRLLSAFWPVCAGEEDPECPSAYQRARVHYPNDVL